MTDETELRHRLTRLAERTAPPPRDDLAEAVVALHRTRRRHTAGVTALAAAVVAAVVATVLLVPQLTTGPAHRPASVSAAGGWSAGVLTAPTRGSLADDSTFVEGVRVLPWALPGATRYVEPQGAADTRHLLYVGDVAGSRFAVVTGEDTTPLAGEPSDPVIAWFLGPAGAPPEAMVLQGDPISVDAYGGPPAFLDADTGALVVVGAPGDRFALSLRPVVPAQGPVERDYAPVAAPDGVAQTVVPVGTRSGMSLRYQVVRDTATWIAQPAASRSTSSAAAPTLSWLREPPAASPADGAPFDARQLLDQLGLIPADVAFTVVWAGDVPSPAAAPGPSRVDLLAATLPSGAVVMLCSIGLAFPDGSTGGTTCGSEIRPAGAPLAEQTFALRIDATDMTGDNGVVSTLALIAPPAATSARALDLDGVLLAEVPLTGGIAVVPFPERTATVETLAVDGSVLESTPTMAMADLGD